MIDFNNKIQWYNDKKKIKYIDKIYRLIKYIDIWIFFFLYNL